MGAAGKVYSCMPGFTCTDPEEQMNDGYYGYTTKLGVMPRGFRY